MQSYRLTIPSSTLRRSISRTPRKMPCYVATSPRVSRQYHTGPFGPFFGRASPFAEISSNLQPFFRLLDEELSNTGASRPLRKFQPRFDVKEEDNAFHLQGELPGIDQNDINIEFKDENTLIISGRSIRESQTDNTESTVKGASAENTETASEQVSSYQKPTVEDEFVDVGEESEKSEKAATSTSTANVTEETKEVGEKPILKSKNKYWVSERSIGEFHRTFTFPGHIDQEAVTASLKDGLLNVTVPKALQKEPRRITIQ